MAISVHSLGRWVSRKERSGTSGGGGRPEAIDARVRWQLRRCYLEHYKQWGPQVLRHWAARGALGLWSATTIAAVIADLRDEAEPRRAQRRYEIIAANVMWSEDGTGFKEHGRKKELVVIQDEHARLKVGYELTVGPADEEAVCRNLERAFAEHRPPLVLKHDGGSIFHGKRIGKLLDRYQVAELTGPRHYPCYNGKKERSMRDIKSFERGMRRHGPRSSLLERIDAAITDLNDRRPRLMLGGRTAGEAFEQDRVPLPGRREFIKEVGTTEQILTEEAMTRAQRASARRRAVEQVRLRYGLMKETGDVSQNFRAAGPTK